MLVDEDGSIRVADFGFSTAIEKAAVNSVTGSTARKARVPYAAPEILTDQATWLTNKEEKRSKTGLMAMAASRQVKWRIGLGTVAVADSKGSRIRRKPVS